MQSYEHSWITVARDRLPADQPWTWRQAMDAGIGRRTMHGLVDDMQVRKVLRGVYAWADLPDTLDLRLAALGLVVPPSAVVVDGTAAWVHAGDAALAPGEHLGLNDPRVFDARRGGRLRRHGVESGTRDMRPDDVIDFGGVRVTTPLRTALDVARLQHPQRALASLDCLLRQTDLQQDELVQEIGRFRGHRGVVQARSLVLWADARAESYGESAVRYVWRITPGLPVPQLQVPVVAAGHTFYLDLADEELMVAVEYDGEAFHGPAQQEHDSWRRGVIADEGWAWQVFDRTNTFGRNRQVETLLANVFRNRRAELSRMPRELRPRSA